MPSRSRMTRQHRRSGAPHHVQASGPSTRANLEAIRDRGGFLAVAGLAFVAGCVILAFTSYHGHSNDLTFAVTAIVGLLATGIPTLLFSPLRPGGRPPGIHPAWLIPLAVAFAGFAKALLPGAFIVGLLGLCAGFFFVCSLVIGSDSLRVWRWDRQRTRAAQTRSSK